MNAHPSGTWPASTEADRGRSIVVVGAGPIGAYVASRLAASNRVTLIDADPGSPDSTQRPQLLRALGEAATTVRPSTHLPTSVTLLHGQVSRISRTEARVVLRDERRVPYDRLVLALGAEPVRPDSVHSGQLPPGIQFAYSGADFQQITEAAQAGQAITIMGGGALAVELAWGLAAWTRVRLVARHGLLSRHVAPEIAARVATHLGKRGVQLALDCPITRVQELDGKVTAWAGDGTMHVSDCLVLACGTRPRTSVAQEAGLPVNRGILVDADMRTTDPRIFAVGDCAEGPMIAPEGGLLQARAAAGRMLDCLSGTREAAPGPQARFATRRIVLGAWSVLGMRRCDLGTAAAQAATKRTPGGIYCLYRQGAEIAGVDAFLPNEYAGRLNGLLVHDPGPGGWRRRLLGLGIIAAPPAQADPVICKCAQVTRSQILALVRDAHADLAQVAMETGATSYCGACTEDVQQLTAPRKTRRAAWARWLAAMVALLVIPVILLWQPITPGPSVTAPQFQLFQLLRDPVTLQVTGYASLLAMLGAVAALASARRTPGRTLLHAALGILALMVMPLHALGGALEASTQARILLGVFTLCVATGALAIFRKITGMPLAHVITTTALLAVTGLHVIQVYWY